MSGKVKPYKVVGRSTAKNALVEIIGPSGGLLTLGNLAKGECARLNAAYAEGWKASASHYGHALAERGGPKNRRQPAPRRVQK
jgi:hypothetical protein